MRKRIEWEWEKLDNHTGRVKVIGGWLVHHISYNEKRSHFSESTVFVADRDHEWHILEPIDVNAQSVPVGNKSADFDPKK